MVKDYTKEFRGNNAGNPERARLAHLVRSGSQSEHRIRFILHAHGASHIVKLVLVASTDPRRCHEHRILAPHTCLCF